MLGRAADDAAGVLAAGNEAFGQNLAVQAAFAQFSVTLCQLFGGKHFVHAHAAAFGGRFHKQRQSEPFCHGVKISLAVKQCEGRHRQSQACPQKFAAVFVHADGRCAYAAAGVGDAQRFQCALHCAVFAVTAVQVVEGSLKTLCLQLRQRGFGRVEQVRVDAPAAQGLQNQAAAGERHFPFGGESAREDGGFAEMLHGYTVFLSGGCVQAA